MNHIGSSFLDSSKTKPLTLGFGWVSELCAPANIPDRLLLVCILKTFTFSDPILHGKVFWSFTFLKFRLKK